MTTHLLASLWPLGVVAVLAGVDWATVGCRTRRVGGIRFFWVGRIVVSVCVRRRAAA